MCQVLHIQFCQVSFFELLRLPGLLHGGSSKTDLLHFFVILLNGCQWRTVWGIDKPLSPNFQCPCPLPHNMLEVTEAPCNTCSCPELASL